MLRSQPGGKGQACVQMRNLFQLQKYLFEMQELELIGVLL